jgi:two-component system, chemotaxis family, CheB/CheR fusion protein
VLAAQQEHFSMEYPCHSATQERWFVMNVSCLRGADGARLGAVVSHVNISAWRQGQSA